jgi:hypothetical protein
MAGVMKVYRPKYTVGALSAARLPSTTGLVRLLGAAEVLAGVGAVIFGSRYWALAVTVFYLGFAWFVAFALRRGIPIASCGCFGSPDTPPRAGHLILNATAVLVALAVAISPVGPWVGLVGVGPGTTVTFLLFSGATVYLLYAVVNVLPQRQGVRRESTVRLSSPRESVDE